MIYAIRAVGTEFVKIGKADSVGKRLKSLETASPHELHIEAVGNWPDCEERRIHRYLEATHVRGEWYRDSAKMEKVIACLRDPEGQTSWKAMCDAKGWNVASKPRQLTAIELRRLERQEWWRKREHSSSQHQRKA